MINCWYLLLGYFLVLQLVCSKTNDCEGAALKRRVRALNACLRVGYDVRFPGCKPKETNGKLNKSQKKRCIKTVKALSVCEGFGCPINGNWGAFSEWSDCNTGCGTGRQTRMRICDDPAPQYGGRGCRGKTEEERECEETSGCVLDGGSTALPPPNINGGWGNFTEWSECGVTCGEGLQTR